MSHLAGAFAHIAALGTKAARPVDPVDAALARAQDAILRSGAAVQRARNTPAQDAARTERFQKGRPIATPVTPSSQRQWRRDYLRRPAQTPYADEAWDRADALANALNWHAHNNPTYGDVALDGYDFGRLLHPKRSADDPDIGAGLDVDTRTRRISAMTSSWLAPYRWATKAAPPVRLKPGESLSYVAETKQAGRVFTNPKFWQGVGTVVSGIGTGFGAAGLYDRYRSRSVPSTRPVKLPRSESLSYVERPLRGDAWEYDPRFARWGRPFVLNANPPPTQPSFVQRLIGRLGELHDVAQWKQGRGPRPANLPPPRPLYPVGSYGHARRGTKAYDRGGYRPHGRTLSGAQRKELVSPLFLRRFGADASADTRLPVTTPGQSGPVVRRLPGRPTRWSDWEAGDLARMEARDELSRVPVQRVLQRAKMLEKSGRLQEVLARLAAVLRSTKAQAPRFRGNMMLHHPSAEPRRFSDNGIRRSLEPVLPGLETQEPDPGIVRDPRVGPPRGDVMQEWAFSPLARRGVWNWVAGGAPPEYTARMNQNWRDDEDQPLVRIPTRLERARYANTLGREIPWGFNRLADKHLLARIRRS
jgi:hypothetical protein